MPISYEIEIVDCVLEVYGHFNDYESEFTVIIQPQTDIDLFANAVCRVLRDSISEKLREFDEQFRYKVERDNTPPQVQARGEVLDSFSLVKVGNLIGEGVKQAENELDSDNRVDNAELNVGLATTLDLFESDYYDEDY